MEIPTLKISKNCALESSLRLPYGANIGGFAKEYDKAVESALLCVDEFVPSKVIVDLMESDAKQAQEICKNINADIQFLREWAARSLQNYLLQHDGVVDQWPNSSMGLKVSLCFHSIDDAVFFYDYFGDDFTYKNGEFQRKTDGLVYRNAYKFSGTEEFNRMNDKAKELKDKADSCGNHTSILLVLFYAVGFFYCAFAALSVLANMFFGFSAAFFQFITTVTQGPNQTVIQKLLHGVLSIFAIPSFLHRLIALLPHGVFYWILTLLLLFMCISGAVYCFPNFREHCKLQKEYKQARRAADSFKNSAEYRQAAVENEETRKKYEAFAEEWQRAWYEWICTAKQAPASNPAGGAKGKG